MIKKSQTMNPKVIAGGVAIVILGLLLVGAYGMNLTTTTYQVPASPTVSIIPNCVTQQVKDAARNEIKNLQHLIDIGTPPMDLLIKQRDALQKEIDKLPKNDPGRIGKQQALDILNGRIQKYKVPIDNAKTRIAELNKILQLPLCPSPTSTPRPTH